MLTIVKSLFISACLLSEMFAALIYARAADIPLRKALTTASQGSEVISRREPRTLSRREIYQAIQNDLAQLGISERGELRPGDLKIQSSVPVLRDDLGLQVKRIGFDPIRRETVFELWTSHEPQYLPFEVTTRRDPQSWGFTPPQEWDKGGLVAQSRDGNPATAQGALWIPRQSPLLAKPGRLATLVMLGQNVRVTTTVVPLQPGIKGQRILVRDPATGRVMTAEVVDEGLLQTSF